MQLVLSCNHKKDIGLAKFSHKKILFPEDPNYRELIVDTILTIRNDERINWERLIKNFTTENLIEEVVYDDEDWEIIFIESNSSFAVFNNKRFGVCYIRLMGSVHWEEYKLLFNSKIKSASDYNEIKDFIDEHSSLFQKLQLKSNADVSD